MVRAANQEYLYYADKFFSFGENAVRFGEEVRDYAPSRGSMLTRPVFAGRSLDSRV